MMMNVEITDSEANVLRDYAKELRKYMDIEKKPYIDTSMATLLISWQSYFHALCVKYNQNPFEIAIDYKNKKFELKKEEDK